MKLVEELVDRLVEGVGDWPTSLITEVHLFGSFARGAPDPHDVDVAVEFQRDKQWASHFVRCMTHGRNPYVVFTRSLNGGRRSYQFIFEARDHSDLELTLLWRRGEGRDVAVSRVRAIGEDTTAGRAPRHGMLPQFEGLDRWIGRADREQVAGALDRGAITLKRLVLRDGEVRDPVVRRRLARRWNAASPLLRAAHAALSHLELRGVNLTQVHLHGQDIHDSTTPYFVGFGLRYFQAVPRCLTEHGGVEWIEVVHPTCARPQKHCGSNRPT